MPVEITYFGNDDNKLAQVCTDAELEIVATQCTENAIGEAYAAAGVPQEYFGSELNEIELLAGAAAPPYVFKLDDDGTLADLFGMGYLPAEEPEFMSYEIVTNGSNTTAAALSARALLDEGSFALVPGKIVVLCECVILEAPAAAVEQSQGVGIAITSDGEIVGYFNVGLKSYDGAFVSYTGTGPETDTQESPLIAASLVGQRVGFYVDSDTGVIGYATSEAGDAGAVTGAIMNVAHRVTQGLYLKHETTGETIAAQLIINADDMGLTYPAGAVDVYGVEI